MLAAVVGRQGTKTVAPPDGMDSFSHRRRLDVEVPQEPLPLLPRRRLKVKFLSFLVSMVYAAQIAGDAATIVGLINDTVADAPTLVGLAAEKYGFPGGLNQAIAWIEANFANLSNYLGVCVFKYDTLSPLR